MSLHYPECDAEQLKLLAELVEAERSVPRSEREYFLVAHTRGAPGVELVHPGWQEDRRVFMGDIEMLSNAGLINLSYTSRGDEKFYVTPRGEGVYTQYKQQTGVPTQRMESTIHKHFDSNRFRSRYPSAYEKWKQAEELLWRGDDANNMTVIGHLAREALQEFTAALVDRFKPANVEQDKTKTVSRLKSIFESQHSQTGKTDAQLAKALIEYWGAVSDLAQRQEHGAARDAAELIWPDARRTVFQTAIVMFEIDSLLKSKS